MTRQQRLDQIARAAVAVEKQLKYPPELLIAQWAIESNWGEAPSGRNNLFGMTFVASRHKSYTWVPTREVLTAEGIKRLAPDEQLTITSRHALPSGKFDVRLSRRFADFETVEEGIIDKVRLLQSGEPYRKAWAQYVASGDLDAFIRTMAPIYATDPGYAALVTTISKQSNVRAAIAAARNAA